MPYTLKKEDCAHCDFCCMCETARSAVYGRAAIFPFKEAKEYGDVQSGPNIYRKPTRFHTLDDIILLPRMFSEEKVKKRNELGREPLFVDVETKSYLGGFRTAIPVVVAAMGSTKVASKVGLVLSEGSANAGIIQVIGENVFNMHGYERRKRADQPSLKERMLAYLENMGEFGGLVIQQNVEDRIAGVWDTIYSDDDFGQYFDRGVIGFEIKGGQGAKPGLGGEVKVDRKLALELKGKYFFPEDPETLERELYERHSVPGTFTPEILREMIKEAREKYPRVPIWFKTGGYKDIDLQIEVASEAGAYAITIDGEGGTGMSPIATMEELGYPTIVCLKRMEEKKSLHMIITGGLAAYGYGAPLVKSLALGADGIAFGRAFLIAAQGRYGPKERPIKTLKNPAKGIENFIERIKVETQMLVSSLGKYSLDKLNKEDVGALKKEVAEMFGIEYIYQTR